MIKGSFEWLATQEPCVTFIHAVTSPDISERTIGALFKSSPENILFLLLLEREEGREGNISAREKH